MEEKKKRKYQCTVCGFEEEFDGEIPSDYVCPVCGADASQFTEVKS